MTLEQMLMQLAEVGFPSVRRCKMDGTWSAHLEIVTGPGGTLNFRSEFDHPTPSSAVVQLMDRVEAARAKLQASLKGPDA
jgi:hypothetical protein